MDEHYDVILICLMALINVHIQRNPFRDTDSRIYQKYKNWLLEIGVNSKESVVSVKSGSEKSVNVKWLFNFVL